MKIIESELVTFFDCDDTILMEAKRGDSGAMMYVDVAGNTCYGIPHKAHIDQVKKHKARGYTVIVWSGNGYKHAKIVVELLGLENHVDYVMSKSIKYWDDLEDANQILTNRVYLNNK